MDISREAIENAIAPLHRQADRGINASFDEIADVINLLRAQRSRIAALSSIALENGAPVVQGEDGRIAFEMCLATAKKFQPRDLTAAFTASRDYCQGVNDVVDAIEALRPDDLTRNAEKPTN